MTLTFNLCKQMFQMALLLLREPLCQIILKFMHKCRSYGLGKLIYVTFKCDLDLQPTAVPKKNVSNSTSSPQGKQLCHTILKSMIKCRSYGLDKSGHAHIHRNKIVTAMSCFTASDSTKNYGWLVWTSFKLHRSLVFDKI